MYTYRLYGLNCESDTAIPGLCPSSQKLKRIDLTIDFTNAPPDWVQAAWRLPAQSLPDRRDPFESPASKVISLGGGEFFELDYADGTRFVIAGSGDRLWVSYLSTLTIEDVGVYLRGPAMGLILQLRGVTALHASAVCLDGRVIALCGARESGKSTTAAALALRGAPVLCEDICALSESGDGTPYVESGYPRICLWPEAVHNLFGTPDALPPLTPNWEKCFLALDAGVTKFETERRPLGGVYILSPRVAEENAPRVEEISAQRAVLVLVQNTYMNWLLDRDRRALEFQVLSNLVTQVPIRRVVPHRDPARIGALCDLIVEDAQRLIKGQSSAANSAI
jgi:hypothetical protein